MNEIRDMTIVCLVALGVALFACYQAEEIDAALEGEGPAAESETPTVGAQQTQLNIVPPCRAFQEAENRYTVRVDPALEGAEEPAE